MLRCDGPDGMVGNLPYIVKECPAVAKALEAEKVKGYLMSFCAQYPAHPKAKSEGRVAAPLAPWVAAAMMGIIPDLLPPTDE
eukprot:7990497-Alexandrium_andersonii.AAC.1